MFKNIHVIGISRIIVPKKSTVRMQEKVDRQCGVKYTKETCLFCQRLRTVKLANKAQVSKVQIKPITSLHLYNEISDVNVIITYGNDVIL